MRVFVDTNVIVSAFLFPNSTPAEALRIALTSHEVIISDYVIDEIRDVCRRKFPEKSSVVEAFIVELVSRVELVFTPANEDEVISLRDPNDWPILAAALDKNADVLLTGGRDFFEADLDNPRVLSPRQFIDTISA